MIDLNTSFRLLELDIYKINYFLYFCMISYEQTTSLNLAL